MVNQQQLDAVVERIIGATPQSFGQLPLEGSQGRQYPSVFKLSDARALLKQSRATSLLFEYHYAIYKVDRKGKMEFVCWKEGYAG